MEAEKRTIELAVLQDGIWELIGDFNSEVEAIDEAGALASQFTGDPIVFGLSADPASGHYETTIEFFADGTCTVEPN